jgi:hypothetical protein
MGIHICVCRPDHTEHPEWDWIRHAGDRDFAKLAATLPSDTSTMGNDLDGELHYRPSNFPAWRAAIAAVEWPNPGRFEHLVDLLEKNPECWIRFSY